MKEGKIDKVIRLNDHVDHKIVIKSHHHRSNSMWSNSLLITNFKRRFKRNLFSIFSLIVALFSSMIIFGFINGAECSIMISTQRQFNYGVASINKENRIASNDSPITLIQSMRIEEKEIIKLQERYDYCRFLPSYQALITPYPNIKINNTLLDNISYLPIYSFVDQSIDRSFLVRGRFPSFDTLNQAVVNTEAYELIKKEMGREDNNPFVQINTNQQFTFYTDDVNIPYISDYFIFDRVIEIVGVVKEMSFLNSPKIFYSYLALDTYMEDTLLNNLSLFQGETSWKDRVKEAKDNEDISNYSHQVFIKDVRNIHLLKEMNEEINKTYALNSDALVKEETLFTILNASTLGLEIFLLIAILGTILILCVMSYTSFSEDLKTSALLMCLGAKREEVISLYIFENMMLAIISLTISFLLVNICVKPLNTLIVNITSLSSLIDVPLFVYRGKYFLFPLFIIVITIFVVVFATFLPLYFSKKICLHEQLKAND